MESLLREIAEEYHQRCDDFDELHCTGEGYAGLPMPATDDERKAMAQNAANALRDALKRGAAHGFTRGEIQRAISAYAMEL
jgi:hypothetical protein